MCNSRCDQAVGIGISAVNVQSAIPAQRIGEQLGMDSCIVNNQYANPLLSRVLGIHKILQRHHSSSAQKLGTRSHQMPQSKQAVLRTRDLPTEGDLFFRGRVEKAKSCENTN